MATLFLVPSTRWPEPSLRSALTLKAAYRAFSALVILQTAVAQPFNFTERVVLLGATFPLDIEGKFLTPLDRVLIIDAGDSCPGELGAARDAFVRWPYLPLVSSGSASVNRGAHGWPVATFFPVLLRWRGTFKICYCHVPPDLADSTGNQDIFESPCDGDHAEYTTAGVVYSTAIVNSGDSPLATCALDTSGQLLEGCTINIESKRGTLSLSDVALLLPDDVNLICGEAKEVAGPLRLISGTRSKSKYGISDTGKIALGPSLSSEGDSEKMLKVCYCEKSAIDSLGPCLPYQWQFPGRLRLVGFIGQGLGGSPLPTVTCYLGTMCRAGPKIGFGFGQGDAAAMVLGSACNSQSASRIWGKAVGTNVIGNSVLAILTVPTDGAYLRRSSNDFNSSASICYCSAGLFPLTSCTMSTSTSMFPILFGFLRVVGLSSQYEVSCAPRAASCPEVPLPWQGDDAQFAQQGRIFVVEHLDSQDLQFISSPCELFGRVSVTEANATPSLSMPWPHPPGKYALCFCISSVGCPGNGTTTYIPTMQYIGNLEVLGSIQEVTLGTINDITMIPVYITLRTASPRVRCCARYAENLLQDFQPINFSGEPEVSQDTICADIAGTSLVPSVRYLVRLVVPGPRSTSESGRYKVFCRASGESGRCANESAVCTMIPVGKIAQLLPVPEAWQTLPWRRAVGADLMTEHLAMVTIGALWLKAVLATASDVGGGCLQQQSDEDAAEGLPCQGVSCLRGASGKTPGIYMLCVCEGVAIVSSVCAGWYALGILKIFGPRAWSTPAKGVFREPFTFHLLGLGFTSTDIVASVLRASCPSFISELPVNATVYSLHSCTNTELVVGDVSLRTPGEYSICWAPSPQQDDIIGARPFRVGTAISSYDEVDCVVGGWQNESSCLAPCGVGSQLWRRPIVTSPSQFGVACPALETLQSCLVASCPEIRSYELRPPSLELGANFELWLSGPLPFPEDVRATLAPLGSMPSSVAQAAVVSGGLESTIVVSDCGPLAPHAALMSSFCVRGDDSSPPPPYELVCKFAGNASMAAAPYIICACRASVVDRSCLGYFPALGQVNMNGLVVSDHPEVVNFWNTAGGVILIVLFVLLLGLLLVLWTTRRRIRRYVSRRKHTQVVGQEVADETFVAVPALVVEASEKAKQILTECYESTTPRTPPNAQPEPEPPSSGRTPPQQPLQELPGAVVEPVPRKTASPEKLGLAELRRGRLPSLGALDVDIYAMIDLQSAPAPQPVKITPRKKAVAVVEEMDTSPGWDERRKQLLDRSANVLGRCSAPQGSADASPKVLGTSKWTNFDDFMVGQAETARLEAEALDAKLQKAEACRQAPENANYKLHPLFVEGFESDEEDNENSVSSSTDDEARSDASGGAPVKRREMLAALEALQQPLPQLEELKGILAERENRRIVPPPPPPKLAGTQLVVILPPSEAPPRYFEQVDKLEDPPEPPSDDEIDASHSPQEQELPLSDRLLSISAYRPPRPFQPDILAKDNVHFDNSTSAEQKSTEIRASPNGSPQVVLPLEQSSQSSEEDTSDSSLEEDPPPPSLELDHLPLGKLPPPPPPLEKKCPPLEEECPPLLVSSASAPSAELSQGEILVLGTEVPAHSDAEADHLRDLASRCDSSMNVSHGLVEDLPLLTIVGVSHCDDSYRVVVPSASPPFLQRRSQSDDITIKATLAGSVTIEPLPSAPVCVQEVADDPRVGQGRLYIAANVPEAAAESRLFEEQPPHPDAWKVPDIIVAPEEGVYLVDNEALGAKTRGLSYRLTQNLQDKDGKNLAGWGGVVRGVDQCNGWLKVGNRYLPMQVNGVDVLRLI